MSGTRSSLRASFPSSPVESRVGESHTEGSYWWQSSFAELGRRIPITFLPARTYQSTEIRASASCTSLVRRRRRTLSRYRRTSSNRKTTILAALSFPKVLQTSVGLYSMGTQVFMEQPLSEGQTSKEPTSAVRRQTSHGQSSAVSGQPSKEPTSSVRRHTSTEPSSAVRRQPSHEPSSAVRRQPSHEPSSAV